MKIQRRKVCLLVAVGTIVFSGIVPASTQAQTREPAIEYASLLDAFTVKFLGERGVGKTGGHLVLDQKHEIMGVFFPEDAKLKVDLVKAGNDQSLYSVDCSLQKSGGSVFTMISVGGSGGYTFTAEGDYELRFVMGDKTITKMPFNVFFRKQGDDFDPKTYTFVDGAWSSLSYLSYSADDEVSPLKFNTWTRKVVFTTTPEPSKMDVTLLQGDEVVAVSPQGTVAWPEWQSRQQVFAFPSNQGGAVFNNTDLMKRSGAHTVRVDLDGKPHQYFNFEVRDGKIVGHDRQEMDYTPREQWLCPRKIRLGLEGTSHVFWLERTESAVSEPATAVEPPSDSAKSNWVIESSADANRPFEITTTNIRMRKDMPISIGDGIVAYATGSQGVGYFVVGEDKPKSIKEGQSYRGDLFFACGKLILLATRNNVTVFSTEVERSVEIPGDEIYLSYQKHSLYGPRMVDADGYLVATVNEPGRLKSKTIVNVIDLSGDNKPIVIPLKNLDFELRDVSSIKVNAAAGKVAVGSKSKGAIYVADIAANADFKKYDISGFDSYGEADMVLTETHILYTDAAGFANIRLLNLATGEVSMPDASQYGGGWGPVGASNGSIFAWSVKEPRNSWAIGDTNAMPLENTGAKSSVGNYGNLGEGRSMSMASDGTVFIAGTKSISESNCLQATRNGEWQIIVDSNGKPVPAIDVIAGNSLIVFKTGKPSTSSEVNLGYATFGSPVILPAVGAMAQSIAEADEPMESKEETESDARESVQMTEIDRAFLDDVIANELIIFNALKQSFSEDDARKRARDAGLETLKNSGRDHLVEEYRKGWK